jgi:hypothetical protein
VFDGNKELGIDIELDAAGAQAATPRRIASSDRDLYFEAHLAERCARVDLDDLAGAAAVDLEHRRISISKQVDRNTGKLRPTKTKRTRTVDIEPALLPLVKALVEQAGEGRLLRMPPDEDRADMLRRHLRVAGCRREALYADDAQRASVRFHSLRDTCLTFMAIRGDDPLRIQRRAGHTSFAMTEKYIAQARRYEAGFGEPFAPRPPLDRSTDWPTEGVKAKLSTRNHSATPTGIET